MGDGSHGNSSNLGYRPSFVFDNEMTGNGAATGFAKRCLLPFVHEDLQHLADMVPQVIDFPRPGSEFRDVLSISKQRGGLTLTTSLLQSHFTGDWSKVNALVTCETSSSRRR